jgi:gliding motility-associated-like protein
MYRTFNIRLFFVLIPLLLFISEGKASHIRAGEITAVMVSSNTYTLTLTIYANRYSSVRDDYANFDFGDGTSQSVFYGFSEVNLNADTYRRTYTYTKTFSGSGTFRISYRELYRNGNIKNIAVSEYTPFYIETYISISSFTGANNPVQLTIPPIDKAAVGEIFVHNPGAIDPDGDSLSYKLVVPRQAAGVAVNGYFTPNYSSSFSMNPVTGDLIWDAPTLPGLYNVAFIIEEWRKGPDGSISRVSFVTRDMQINVINSLNNPPVVIIPDDTCIVAGTHLIKVIKGTDPDGDILNLYAYPSTYFTVFNPQPPVATGNFNWLTKCSDVRDQPYTFVFKAEDAVNHDTLTNYKTWQVRVKGPAPTGLTAVSAGNSITLSWDPYTCTNALKMEIYRKACDSSGYLQDPCESGITGFPGYIKIGEVPISPLETTSFLDNNQGKGLNRGVEYCYIIVAKFPVPKGGESYASAETCESVQLNVPVITNISVTVTSSTAGNIMIDWLAPLTSPLPGPYTYNVYRADGLAGTNFSVIASGVIPPYNDASLNTLDQSYRYRIELVGGGNSDPASSVFLKTNPANNSIKLKWDSNVPWKEDSVYIYRSVNGGAYTQVANLAGNPRKYNDNIGLTNCDTACYYVRVFSSYCDPQLPSVAYDNLSETSCDSPSDGKLPKTPVLTVKGCEGDLTVFYDLLDWNDVTDPVCSNIKKYNIYFSEYEDTELHLIAHTDYTVTDYIYNNLQSTAGCFAVAAVNKSGVEGKKSEKICVDDCVYYELPNLVTPNGDSLNDKFKPFPIPRGVEVVKFKVYNRWGGLVFSIDNDIHLNWTGISLDNQKVSDGVYYFSAEVKYFRRKNKDDENRVIKGWVQILNQKDVQSFE